MSEKTQAPIDEAVLDLLIKQAVEGLEPAEQRALDALDDAQLSGIARELEQAAAAALLVGLDTSEPLPAMLRERIEKAAPAALAGPASTAPATTPTRPAARVRRASAGGGWWAAAACLVLALIGWLRLPSNQSGLVAHLPQTHPQPPQPQTQPQPQAQPPAAETTLEEQRAALLAQTGTVDVPLAGTAEPGAAGVKADVVWNERLQQGVLRVVGLPANDPTVQQYQLWIFDAGRDARYPVDGGVFDIPAGRPTVLIPIRAQLTVHSAAAFAVTVEKPGGVVVSARDHVVALGKIT
ncbi:MAG TPA: anti-sigma factor [Steroidobacteraceae bacterium]|nr:anti-sigma factor [Steroidobacteraceae bacterium]